MPFPANPNYGTGAAKRIIRLSHAGDGTVTGHLTDNYHEMRVRVGHAAGVVTCVDGEMIRFPTTACLGAPEMVRELVGTPLDTDPQQLLDPARQRRNCTHLFDIAIMAIRHASRAPSVRVYEAVVPDQVDVAVSISVSCNGAPVHSWLVRDGHIISPERLAGLPLLKGFTRWSSNMFADDNLEAATLLGRTCFIATVRPYAPEASAGAPVQLNVVTAAACYAYAAERLAGATYTDQVGEVPQERDIHLLSPSG